MKEVTVKLKEAVIDGSDTITEIVIRRPLAKELKKMRFGGSDMGYQPEQILEIAAECSKYTMRVFDKLVFQDMVQVIEAVSGFLSAGESSETS